MWLVWVEQWPKYLTLWLTGPDLRITFVQYFIAFRSRPEATSDVISGSFPGHVVPDNRVRFSDPCLIRFREILPEAV